MRPIGTRPDRSSSQLSGVFTRLNAAAAERRQVRRTIVSISRECARTPNFLLQYALVIRSGVAPTPRRPGQILHKLCSPIDFASMSSCARMSGCSDCAWSSSTHFIEWIHQQHLHILFGIVCARGCSPSSTGVCCAASASAPACMRAFDY